jgi:hypothetical protein
MLDDKSEEMDGTQTSKQGASGKRNFTNASHASTFSNAREKH